MNKKGFTYIEIMVSIAIFLIISTLVVRINIVANKNVNFQIDKQNMIMIAQKLLEKFKTTTTGTESYFNGEFEKVDGYYCLVQYKIINQGSPTLFEVTVKIRKNIDDKNNEVILISHFLKK